MDVPAWAPGGYGDGPPLTLPGAPPGGIPAATKYGGALAKKIGLLARTNAVVVGALLIAALDAAGVDVVDVVVAAAGVVGAAGVVAATVFCTIPLLPPGLGLKFGGLVAAILVLTASDVATSEVVVF